MVLATLVNVSETLSRWSSERVVGLAPDAASITAARRLAFGSGWSEEGCSASAVWGQCKGSGKTAYRTVVALNGPAYQCSCPSRKFPCKHSLSLLLRWAEGAVRPGEPADYVLAWLSSRAERAEKQAAKAAAPAKPRDEQAAAERAEARAQRVSAGLAELDRWLTDQVRGGLAGLQGKPYSFSAVAARMVDAQAPAVSSWLWRLPGVILSGPGWPDRLLEEFALLRLLVRAHARLPELDAEHPAMAATVRAHVGYPMATEAVRSTPAVRDHWAVYAVRDTELDNLIQRSVYLHGQQTNRMATIRSYAAGGQPLDDSLAAGDAFDGELHFYPGARPWRAVLGNRHAALPAFPAPPERTAREAVAKVAAALALDPWTRAVTAFVTAQPIQRDDGRWVGVDTDGTELPLLGAQHWTWLSLCLGVARPTLLEWTPSGWLPLATMSGSGSAGTTQLGVLS